MPNHLTRAELENYTHERNRIGREKFIPIVDVPAHAMVLIIYFGKYDLEEAKKTDDNSEIILRFAIKPNHENDFALSHRKWLNSVRSNLSQLRRSIRKKGSVPQNFSIIDKGFVPHTDGKHIIVSVEYRHQEAKKIMTEIEMQLTGSLTRAKA